MMGVYKRAVTQKARVEGSISTDYLGREITYFCSHYFKTLNLVSNAGLRNDPENESMSSTSLSICKNSGHPSGQCQGRHFLEDEEYNSARVHILINCVEVKPYLDMFLTVHEDGERRIHAEFADWFKSYVYDDRNGVTNRELRSLAWGPKSEVSLWSMWFINGYKFHTKARSRGKKTTNCGVCVKGVTQSGEDDFYGIIEHIYELEYHGLSKIPIFYCQWYDPTTPRGTRVHPQYKIVQINKRKRYRYYDPFIIAQKARQVYFVDYPDMCKDLRDWCVAIATKPRGHVEVDEIIQETQADESPFQADESVVPMVEIEMVGGLVDESVEGWDREVDPIPEPVGGPSVVIEEIEHDTDDDDDES